MSVTNGWYQIEPLGDHPNAKGRVVQVLDETALRAVAENFRGEMTAYTNRYNRDFPGLPIDQEHEKLDPTGSTEANGWLMDVRFSPGVGLEGNIRWTDTGRPKVAGGSYRFFSTEYDRASVTPVSGDPARIRPTKLVGLTLTNLPNNLGARPITNRQQAPAAPQDPPREEKHMKTVAIKLGLQPDAAEGAVLDAVTKLQTDLAAAEVAKTTLTNRANTAEAEIETIRNRAADEAVKDFATKAKLTPEETADARAMYLSNRAAYDRYAARVLPAAPAAGATPPVLKNRAEQPPGIKPEDPAGSNRQAVSVRVKAQEIQSASPTLPWTECWRQATAACAAV